MSELVVGWLYADLMNIYGDRGNVLALTQRALWRGIKARVLRAGLGVEPELAAANLIFFGGGQDKDQSLVYGDLIEHKAALLELAARRGVPILAVCGGYQLLAHHYLTAEGERLPGLGLIDAHTVAGPTRLIGDVVAEADPALGLSPSTLVGFENHSGRTHLGPGARPLARVIVGGGNNGADRGEGAICGSIIGSYLHGSLLPKNPQLADHLLALALGRPLEPLDDQVELDAHQQLVARTRGRSQAP